MYAPNLGQEWLWRLIFTLSAIGAIAAVVWIIKAIVWIFNHVKFI